MTDVQDKESLSLPRFFSTPKLENLSDHPALGHFVDPYRKRKKKTKNAEDELDGRVSKILERTGVPTKADIDDLGNKIADLAEKIDELKEAQS